MNNKEVFMKLPENILVFLCTSICRVVLCMNASTNNYDEFQKHYYVFNLNI